MKDFETWFKELCENYVWFLPASQHHKPETFKTIANRVYMQCVAEGIFKPMSECRKHVYNIVCKTPGDKPKAKPWYEQALEKKIQQDAAKEEWKPVSEEERARRLKEWDKLVLSSPIMNNFPRLTPKEKEENGEWIPVKPNPYPSTSEDEVYVRQRHVEYIKQNYEARTALPLPTWIPEEQFNLSYPNKYIMHFLTKAKEILTPKDLKLINVDDLETSYKNILKRIRLYRDELQYSKDKDFIDAKEKRIQMLKVISEDLRLLMETVQK